MSLGWYEREPEREDAGGAQCASGPRGDARPGAAPADDERDGAVAERRDRVHERRVELECVGDHPLARGAVRLLDPKDTDTQGRERGREAREIGRVDRSARAVSEEDLGDDRTLGAVGGDPRDAGARRHLRDASARRSGRTRPHPGRAATRELPASHAASAS
jgi:hypothetical protein